MVRLMGSAHMRPLVKLDLRPGKTRNKLLLGFLGVSRAIGVLDAQENLAAGVFGVQGLEERGAERADMKPCRGTRREAGSNHGDRVYRRCTAGKFNTKEQRKQRLSGATV